MKVLKSNAQTCGDDGDNMAVDGESEAVVEQGTAEACAVLAQELQALQRRYTALFEWCDGPLVHAMRRGDAILLDESAPSRFNFLLLLLLLSCFVPSDDTSMHHS